MSSESPKIGSSDWIQQTTETSAAFIRWLAELIQRRNWFMLLVLIGVLLTLSSVFLRDILNRWLPEEHQDSIWGTVTIVITLAFAAALAVAVVTQNRTAAFSVAAMAERKAIKGLRAFGKEDAEIFTRLQRDRKLKACLETLTADNFGFVILMGESGCGKTSFLQAGVWPRLSVPEASHQAIYVRLSERSPLEAIQQAIAAQLELPIDWLQPLTSPVNVNLLQDLLVQAIEAAGKPVILLLDQFEQFFVQFPREQDRAEFIQALAVWYRHPQFVTAKILVSIRADLAWRLYEIQQALGYALGTDNCIQLEKFSSQDAAQVLLMIAETENLSCDHRFIAELAENELASTQDGLISPVDIQILAWMIERQTAEELRAFNRQAFQKFGGVEGLLTRFLQRTLETLPLPSQRQTAIKVLLALTDQEQQVRAGVQTITDVQDQLKADAKPHDVHDALTWLANSGVRLITPVERQGENGYELAHERLIPALMRQAGKELTAVDKTNSLLDRRVNEWLGNQRHPRYLLRWKELRLIQRYQTYIVWGARETQKRQLLKASQQKGKRILSRIGLMLLILSLFLGGLFYIPQGQMQVIRWALDVSLPHVSSDFVAYSTVAIGIDGNWPKAFRLARRLVRQESATADFLKTAVALVPRLHADQQTKVTPELITTTKGITDPKLKADILRAIAQAYGQIGDATVAAAALQQVLSVAEDIPEAWPKSNALSAIAQAYGQIGDTTVAATALQQALSVAEDIPEVWPKSNALNAIAQAYGQIGDATVAAAALQQALSAAEDIPEAWPKSSALSAIAQAYGQVGDDTVAAAVLQQALIVVKDFPETWSKSSALSTIAQSTRQMKATVAAAVLQQALSIAEDFSNAQEKSSALNAIALATGQIEDATVATAVLQRSLSVAEDFLPDEQEKPSALSTVAQAYSQVGDDTVAAAVLQQALSVAEDFSDTRKKSSALSTIASASSQIGDATVAAAVLQRALSAAEEMPKSWEKFSALRAIIQAIGQLSSLEVGQSFLVESIISRFAHF